MGIKSLDQLKKSVEKANTRGSGGNRFFSVNDGGRFKIWFLQEVAEDGASYDEENGAAELVRVVQSPNDWTKRAVATDDLEEFDYKSWTKGQEGLDRGWRAKEHVLVNIAMREDDNEVNDWEPRVLDQKLSPAHIGSTLLDCAEAYGTLLDRPYQITRRGKGPDTQYQLIALPEEDRPEELEDLEMHDLNTHYKVVAPENQEAFYLGLDDKSAEEPW